MWPSLLDGWRITPPAIWGKLPGHADFVRSGVRRGEGDAWVSWLSEHCPNASVGCPAKAVGVPVSFVLPPGALAFAPRRFVLGVIARSTDITGHHHTLVIYQQAGERWVKKHFEAQLRHPSDWQFWLARAIARHARVDRVATIAEVRRTVKALWRDQRGAFAALRNAAWPDIETAAFARRTHVWRFVGAANRLEDLWSGLE
jgi:type VI secretion system protein ImpM